jgi:predicted membrane-bound spermidine synthase
LNHARLIPALVAMQAAVAAASLVVEIIAGRMLAPYVGMSVHTWTSVIAVVLAGFSAGHWLGGRIAERTADRALRLTGWALAAAALSTAAAVLLLRWGSGPVIGALDSPVAVIVALTGLAFFLPSFFAGVPAPVLAEIGAKHDPARSGRTLGAMFAASAFGAILGTVSAGFVFIAWLGSTLTLVLVSAIYLALALVLFRLGGARGGATALCALPVALAAWAGLRADPCDVESRYFCIRVVDLSADAASPVRLMVLDHLAHGISARDAPGVMFTDHTALLDALGRRALSADGSAFFIGGGSFSIPRAWAALTPPPAMTVAEIDPEVTRIAAAEFWFDPTSARVRNSDARVALARDAARHDVIVGDAFTDIAVPVHLVSREFFALVRDRLTPGGVYLMNVVDHAGHLRALAAITRTLDTVFPSVEIWTEARPAADGERKVFVIRAAAAPSAEAAFDTLSPAPIRFARLSAAWKDRMLAETPQIVLTDDHAPIERLMHWGD